MYLYLPANTGFHSLHPVTKLLLLFLLITISFLAPGLPGILVLLVLYVGFLLAANGAGNLKTFWKMLVLFWIFTFLIWIFVPRLQGVPWTYSTAALLATRIDCFVIAGLLFATTTRIEEFTLALTRLGVPYKGAFALSLAFRLVPLFYQNLQFIVDAQKSRGVDLESGGIIAKAKQYVPIFGVLISYSIRNADIMAMALESRGFAHAAERTSYLQPRFALRDVALAVAGLAILCALVLVR